MRQAHDFRTVNPLLWAIALARFGTRHGSWGRAEQKLLERTRLPHAKPELSDGTSAVRCGCGQRMKSWTAQSGGTLQGVDEKPPGRLPGQGLRRGGEPQDEGSAAVYSNRTVCISLALEAQAIAAGPEEGRRRGSGGCDAGQKDWRCWRARQISLRTNGLRSISGPLHPGQSALAFHLGVPRPSFPGR